MSIAGSLQRPLKRPYGHSLRITALRLDRQASYRKGLAIGISIHLVLVTQAKAVQTPAKLAEPHSIPTWENDLDVPRTQTGHPESSTGLTGRNRSPFVRM